MAKIDSSQQLVLKPRNAKLKTLNDFIVSVVASILESEDRESAADKLNKSARSYLRARSIAIPEEIEPATVKFRVMHHGQPVPSTSRKAVKLKPRRCNPFAWRYVGWYRDGGRVIHVYENECGDMVRCGGHKA